MKAIKGQPIRRDRRGYSLLMISMLILSSVMIISFSTSDILRVNLSMAATQIDSTMAYFAAEAGMERSLWEVRKQHFDIQDLCSDGDFLCFNASGELASTTLPCGPACLPGDTDTFTMSGNGAFYQIRYNDLGANNELTAIGTKFGTNRVLKVRFPKYFDCQTTCSGTIGCWATASQPADSIATGEECCDAALACYDCDPQFYWDPNIITCVRYCPVGMTWDGTVCIP